MLTIDFFRCLLTNVNDLNARICGSHRQRLGKKYNEYHHAYCHWPHHNKIQPSKSIVLPQHKKSRAHIVTRAESFHLMEKHQIYLPFQSKVWYVLRIQIQGCRRNIFFGLGRLFLLYCTALFRNKRFVLIEIFQQKSSNFVIFCIWKISPRFSPCQLPVNVNMHRI